MQRPLGGTAAIVIPTGRSGFCCVVPCALMLALEAGAVAAALLLARHLVRRAHRGQGRECEVRSATMPVKIIGP